MINSLHGKNENVTRTVMEAITSKRSMFRQFIVTWLINKYDRF